MLSLQNLVRVRLTNIWFDKISSGVLVVPIRRTIGKEFSHHTRRLFVCETRVFILETSDNVNGILHENVWLLLQTRGRAYEHTEPPLTSATGYCIIMKQKSRYFVEAVG